MNDVRVTATVTYCAGFPCAGVTGRLRLTRVSRRSVRQTAGRGGRLLLLLCPVSHHLQIILLLRPPAGINQHNTWTSFISSSPSFSTDSVWKARHTLQHISAHFRSHSNSFCLWTQVCAERCDLWANPDLLMAFIKVSILINRSRISGTDPRWSRERQAGAGTETLQTKNIEPFFFSGTLLVKR